MDRPLSLGEIHRIVNSYIGVSGGYLGDFGYRTLDEFYPVYCDLEIAPTEYSQGTTRERFIATLQAQPPDIQAKILRGLLFKLPEPTASGPNIMSREQVLRVITRLEGLPVAAPALLNALEVVERALSDSEALLNSGGATSAVDRLHTALHGYLKDLCDSARIAHEPDASAPRLLRLLRDQHPAMRSLGARSEDITKVLLSMGSAVDSLGAIRNTASVAHPNDALVDQADAMLVINATRTILHYIDARLGTASAAPSIDSAS